MRRMDKLSNNKASALLLVTRERTEIRRVAKFVYSIKHYSLFVFGSVKIQYADPMRTA